MVSPGPGWIQGWTSSSEGGCHPFGGLLLHFKSTSVLDVPGLHESWDWTRIDASDKTPATNCGKTAVVVERFTFGLRGLHLLVSFATLKQWHVKWQLHWLHCAPRRRVKLNLIATDELESLVNPNVKFWILFGHGLTVVIKASRPLSHWPKILAIHLSTVDHRFTMRFTRLLTEYLEIGEKGFRTGHVSNLVHGKDGTSANLGSVCSKNMYGIGIMNHDSIMVSYRLALSLAAADVYHIPRCFLVLAFRNSNP